MTEGKMIGVIENLNESIKKASHGTPIQIGKTEIKETAEALDMAIEYMKSVIELSDYNKSLLKDLDELKAKYAELKELSEGQSEQHQQFVIENSTLWRVLEVLSCSK